MDGILVLSLGYITLTFIVRTFVDIYKWTGPLSCNGCPVMSLCNDQDSLMKHFTLITCKMADFARDEFHFVNVARG
jgi:hypothetical protein